MDGDIPGTADALARFGFGAGLLHVRSDLPVARDGSFTAWSDRYNGLVLRVPGVRRVRRFELVGAFAGQDPEAADDPGADTAHEPAAEQLPEPARHLTLYDLKHPAVLHTPAFRDMAALGAPGQRLDDAALDAAFGGTRIVGTELRRWPGVSTARLFPAGGKILHLALQGDAPGVERWLTTEAVPALLRAVGAVGVRWFDAGADQHLVLCELQGPIWPLPPSIAPGIGPAVWTAYRQLYLRDAPGE